MVFVLLSAVLLCLRLLLLLLVALFEGLLLFVIAADVVDLEIHSESNGRFWLTFFCVPFINSSARNLASSRSRITCAPRASESSNSSSSRGIIIIIIMLRRTTEKIHSLFFLLGSFSLLSSPTREKR